MHSKPIAIVRFSMNLYFSHTPLVVWNILSLLQIAMSHTSTMNLYEVAMTIPVYQQLDWPQHQTTAILGADNMHYITYIHTPTLDKFGTVKFTTIYNTVNIWEKFSPPNTISNYDKPHCTMLPNLSSKNIQAIENSIVFDIHKANKWLNSSWDHAVKMKSQNISMHAYPKVANNTHVEPPKIHIHQPIHNASTSSYKHVRKILEWLYLNKIKAEGYKLIVLFADEQLVCCIWHLLALMGSIWGDIIPFPGDFHLVIHVNLGIMRAGKEYLMSIAELLGYKYIKVDFQLEHWSEHDNFLLMVADYAVHWLLDLLPERYKNISFERILKKIAPNKHISF